VANSRKVIEQFQRGADKAVSKWHKGETIGKGETMDSASNAFATITPLENVRQRKLLSNRHTILGNRPAGLIPSTWKEVFAGHAEQIRRALSCFNQPGLLCLVVGDSGLLAQHWIEARDDVNVAIAGRHPRVDIPLPGDVAISLRHMAILVTRTPDGVRYRVIELRSPIALRNERGERLESVEASGPSPP
jgi:hypothetical protein